MASTAASYPKPGPTACRTRIAEPKMKLTHSQVARTLDELCAMGFIERVKDDFGTTRYRPIYPATKGRRA